MSMTVQDFINVLPFYFKNSLTPFLWGKHGIGKSQCIKQFAEANNLEFIDIRLGQFEVGDLLGIPRIKDMDTAMAAITNYLNLAKQNGISDAEKDKQIKEILVSYQIDTEAITEYAMPKWLQIALRGNCLILWDEINRAKIDVIQAVFQAVLDRRMHLFKFPETTYQVCASNPNVDEYVVTDIADAAFMSRFGHIVLVPSVKEWIDYASDKTFHQSVIDFIRLSPEQFGEHTCELPIQISPNPRALEFVSRFAFMTTDALEFRGKDYPALSDAYFAEVIKGIVGLKAAASYLEQIHATDKPIPTKMILDEYPKAKELLKKYTAKEKSRQDLVKVSLDNLIKELTKASIKDISKAHLDNALKFIEECPNDSAFAGYKELAAHATVGTEWAEYLAKNNKVVERVHKLSEKESDDSDKKKKK